jgi:AcrR family transcriptional regulator
VAAEGHSLQEIARRAGVSRGTVRSYLQAGQYHPCGQRKRRLQSCDAYAAYLRARWEEGEQNSAMLLAEIQAQGYRGAASTVRQYVRTWRTGPRHMGRRRQGEDASGPPPPTPLSLRAFASMAWLVRSCARSASRTSTCPCTR